ncbi:NUDIX hydrolase [Candidatus Nanohalococcus occultus]|uniref:NUDIX family hydrolase n=1 Tax=Candidatus Nanohalococcus occultus TaxID=2978047 RepID=A0ABY8CJ83_9ARCH|nr:NUDIX family hydrolase [Candidatus Nanohaloarchaeota archaeon SVXNc]
MRVPEEADRDFTASCFIVEDGKVLFLKHSKLGKWLPPGGHIEADETPDEAALRETLEETGWKVRISKDFVPETSYDSVSQDLPRPFNVNIHPISDDHLHCDFQFLGEPIEKQDASHGHEHDGLEWFTIEEIEEIETPENARVAARKALRLARDR